MREWLCECEREGTHYDGPQLAQTQSIKYNSVACYDMKRVPLDY